MGCCSVFRLRFFCLKRGSNMATTKIWPVRGRIGRVVDYVENPEKTENPDFGRALYEVMIYATNPEKTEQQY